MDCWADEDLSDAASLQSLFHITLPLHGILRVFSNHCIGFIMFTVFLVNVSKQVSCSLLSTMRNVAPPTPHRGYVTLIMGGPFWMNDQTCRKHPAVNPFCRSLGLLSPYIRFMCACICVILVAGVTLEAIKHTMKAQMASTQANEPVCVSVFF